MAYRQETVQELEDLFTTILTCWVTLEKSLLPTSQCTHLQKEDNVVQIIFIKCLGRSRKNLDIISEGLWCLNRKRELRDLLMTCTLCARIKIAIYAILKHNLLFHVLNDSCLKFLCENSCLCPTTVLFCEYRTQLYATAHF